MLLPDFTQGAGTKSAKTAVAGGHHQSRTVETEQSRPLSGLALGYWHLTPCPCLTVQLEKLWLTTLGGLCDDHISALRNGHTHVFEHIGRLVNRSRRSIVTRDFRAIQRKFNVLACHREPTDAIAEPVEVRYVLVSTWPPDA